VSVNLNITRRQNVPNTIYDNEVFFDIAFSLCLILLLMCTVTKANTARYIYPKPGYVYFPHDIVKL